MENLIKQIINDPQFAQGVAWTRRNFRTNETIVKEGDVGKSLFYVESGHLRVSVDVELDDHHSAKPGISDLSKGDLFGDTCLHESGVRTATVIGTTDGCLLEINGDKLGAYLDAHPLKGYEFYKLLFQILFKRLSNGNRRIQYLLAWGMKARHASEKSTPTFRKI